jgi:hypothetical protein
MAAPQIAHHNNIQIIGEVNRIQGKKEKEDITRTNK